MIEIMQDTQIASSSANIPMFNTCQSTLLPAEYSIELPSLLHTTLFVCVYFTLQNKRLVVRPFLISTQRCSWLTQKILLAKDYSVGVLNTTCSCKSTFPSSCPLKSWRPFCSFLLFLQDKMVIITLQKNLCQSFTRY